MPENPLERIRAYLSNGEIETALQKLDLWLQANAKATLSNDVALWLADLRRGEREFSQSLITLPDLRALQQKITRGILILLNELGSGKPALHSFHCYTCDRVEQTDTFIESFQQKQDEKKQFYFLYGWERQSHLGMFRRIAYELEGAFLDDLSPNTEPGAKSRQMELRLRPTRKEQLFKIEIIKNLFHLLEVKPEDHEPLLDKSLAYLASFSPLLQDFSEKDYLCIYIPILSYDWDAQITPAVASWVMESFCKDSLPANCPNVFFFFAVVFEEEDQDLVDEIRQIVGNSRHIRPLPELEKVARRDIRRWFTVYHQITESAEARDVLISTHFGNGQDPLDMETVELNLRKIIDQYNNTFVQ